MITVHMYDLQMMHDKNGYRTSSHEKLDEVSSKYPLNEHAMAMLGLYQNILSRFGMMSQKLRTKDELHRIVTTILLMRRVTSYPQRKQIVTPLQMPNQVSPTHLILFFLLKLFSLRIVSISKCGVGGYICVHSYYFVAIIVFFLIFVCATYFVFIWVPWQLFQILYPRTVLLNL